MTRKARPTSGYVHDPASDMSSGDDQNYDTYSSDSYAVETESQSCSTDSEDSEEEYWDEEEEESAGSEEEEEDYDGPSNASDTSLYNEEDSVYVQSSDDRDGEGDHVECDVRLLRSCKRRCKALSSYSSEDSSETKVNTSGMQYGYATFRTDDQIPTLSQLAAKEVRKHLSLPLIDTRVSGDSHENANDGDSDVTVDTGSDAHHAKSDAPSLAETASTIATALKVAGGESEESEESEEEEEEEEEEDGEFNYETSADSLDEDNLCTEFKPIPLISPPQPKVSEQEQQARERAAFIARGPEAECRTPSPLRHGRDYHWESFSWSSPLPYDRQDREHQNRREDTEAKQQTARHIEAGNPLPFWRRKVSSSTHPEEPSEYSDNEY